MTDQERYFYDVTCEAFIGGQSFEEYKEYLLRWLMLSPWHYSLDGGRERIDSQIRYVEECYLAKESVASAGAEVGYACG